MLEIGENMKKAKIHGLLLIVFMVSMVFAIHQLTIISMGEDVSATIPLSVHRYPAKPLSMQPVLVYLKSGGLHKAKLDTKIRVVTSAKASVIEAPSCSGTRQLSISITLSNGGSVSNALVIVKNTLTGSLCSASLDNGKGTIGLNGGSYVFIAFYDEDGDGLYEYAGAASLTISPLSGSTVNIVVKPITELLDTRLYSLGEIEALVEQPMVRIPGYYVSVIPGLPSLDIKLSTSALKSLLADISTGISELYVSVRSFVNYRVIVDNNIVAEDSYEVTPGIYKVNLPPVAVALVPSTTNEQEIQGEAFGLAPSGWSYPGGKQLNVTIIAFDDNAIEDLGFYISINGKAWERTTLYDLPAAKMLKEAEKYYNQLVSSINELFSIIASLGANINVAYEFKLPALELKYTLIPGQSPGNYVLFRARVSDGRKEFVTPTSIYYTYNGDSKERILIVDPNILVWLTKYNSKIYGNLIYNVYIRNYPIVSDYMASLYTSTETRQLMKLINLFQPFHHWEYLGSKYRIRIITNLSRLSDELKSYKPNVIILSNLWLGLNLTKSSTLNWDLSDLRQVSSLIDYVKERHAGLIVTHAALSDLIVWIAEKNRAEKIKVMPRGHVGYTLRDISIIDEKTVAGCVGLGMLPMYEYLRDTIANYIIKSSKESPWLATLGAAIGSIPLLVPWVPWNGSLMETNATYMLGWTIPKEPIEIPNPYSEQHPSIRAYTLVGWQLGSPIVQAEASIKAARHVANIAKQYYDRLNNVITNVTATNMRVNYLLYNSLRSNLSLIYSVLANTTMKGAHGLVIASIGNLKIPVNITLPREALERMVALSPTKLVAVSPNGLAGIVTYDRYWDPSTGFRAVYFSFEIEAGTNNAAKQLLLEAVDWALRWKPINMYELLKNIANMIVKEAGTKAEQTLRNSTLLAHNITIATRKGGILEYALEPGVYHVLIKGLGRVNPNISGTMIEKIMNLTPLIKLITIKIKKPTKLRLVLRGDNKPAIVLVFKGKGIVQKGIKELLIKLQEKTKSILKKLPGKPEINETIVLREEKEIQIPVVHEKLYIVVAYNGTLSINISGGAAIIEEPEPGLYIIAVYTGKPGEVSLSIAPGGAVVSVALSVKGASPVDFNGDGIVDYRDLAILAKAYGASRRAKSYSLVADINCDGIIDYRDLAIFAAKYGKHVG